MEIFQHELSPDLKSQGWVMLAIGDPFDGPMHFYGYPDEETRKRIFMGDIEIRHEYHAMLHNKEQIA